MEMAEIKEFGHCKCALGHEFDVTDCRLSAFDSKPCPKCGCASRIEYIFSKEIEKPRDYYITFRNCGKPERTPLMPDTLDCANSNHNVELLRVQGATDIRVHKEN
jgi:hypothetical protein